MCGLQVVLEKEYWARILTVSGEEMVLPNYDGDQARQAVLNFIEGGLDQNRVAMNQSGVVSFILVSQIANVL